jgi:hypothetical protein
MVRSGEIEFLADTILLQKVATIQYGLHKTAGFGDTLKGMLGDGLSSISSGVQSELKSTLDTGSTESIILSVGRMIMTGGLFLLWPPLGIINAVARATLGIDAMTIAQKIWRIIRGPLQERGQVTQSEVSDATRDVTFAMAGPRDSSFVKDKRAEYDLLSPLRVAEANGQLYHFVKNAFSMEEMAGYFSKISPFKSRSIVGGMVGWAIKAALLGAGLMVATGSLARLVGLRKKEESEEATNVPTSGTPNTSGPTTDALYRTNPVSETADEEKSENIAEGKLTSTGRGTDYHTNDHVKSQWIVPMVGGSLENTLVAWARDVYLEMSNIDDSVIRSTPSFNKIVSEMSRFLESGSKKITIPPRYKTRKQIVDQFARDALKI